MRLPIQYALAYPDRLATPTESLNLLAIQHLTFEPIDAARFPCPGLAYQAGRLGQSYPAVLNAANEEAVRLFLAEELPFHHIPAYVEQALEAHLPMRQPDVEAVEEVDSWARRHVREKVLRGRSDVMISASL
jgi:1-deoxy-D-xylulose-5-phosphate reductoisomerase